MYIVLNLRSLRGFFVGSVAGALVVGCAGEEPVARLVDGRAIATRFIDVDAYDAYLLGALAEASGNDREALDAFREAAKSDPKSADIWTRMGASRCRVTPSDERADGDFLRALSNDSSYAPAYRARAACEARRGKTAESADDVRRADAADPNGARADATAGYAKARAIDPAMRREAAAAVEQLYKYGHEVEARHLAGLVADAVDDPSNGRRDPLPADAARLAVDDAILRDDAALLDRRLVETRTTAEDGAARARALHHPELAAKLDAKIRAAAGS